MKKQSIAEIYVGRNKINGKIYVGSTVKGGAGRISTHKLNLNRKSHCNKYLQNSWDKYGPDGFEWDIVEICKPEEQLQREQWWIEYLHSYDPECGYNIINPVRSICPAPRRSQMSKEIWEIPGNRESVSRKSSERWLDPEYREKMTQVSLEQWKDPERKARHNARLKDLWNSPEHIEAHAERNRKRWEDPEKRKAHGAIVSDLWDTPEYRAKQDKIMRERWDDPSYQKKISTARKEMWQDPEYRAKISLKRKEYWAKWRAERGITEPVKR